MSAVSSHPTLIVDGRSSIFESTKLRPSRDNASLKPAYLLRARVSRPRQDFCEDNFLQAWDDNANQVGTLIG